MRAGSDYWKARLKRKTITPRKTVARVSVAECNNLWLFSLHDRCTLKADATRRRNCLRLVTSLLKILSQLLQRPACGDRIIDNCYFSFSLRVILNQRSWYEKVESLSVDRLEPANRVDSLVCQNHRIDWYADELLLGKRSEEHT